MAKEEQVLVVETKVIEKIGLFHGLMFDTEKYITEIFRTGVPTFIPRSQAENDPGYKQLIPYVIMTCGGKYLSYVRGKRAGETRLVGNRSIGIGGHINPVDDMPLFNNFYDTYLAAVDREVEEEVHVGSPYEDMVVALLNDDTNEVGKVHLGIVHCRMLQEPKVERREQMITQLGFLSPEELQLEKNTLETWSALCVENLDKIMTSQAR